MWISPEGCDPFLPSQQRKSYRRKDGVFLYFEDNAGVIVNNKGEMKGGEKLKIPLTGGAILAGKRCPEPSQITEFQHGLVTQRSFSGNSARPSPAPWPRNVQICGPGSPPTPGASPDPRPAPARDTK
ncbi:hypothetical protein DV515_00018211 [Chloebia gouldiae]|uniref:60S ribosomal protein L23 n=1 Tax=Chloebia gouldiae TaxID=44316 RepID=A0A3L8Q870_CHLGU|nr:hypothetical protein DV515_00018211 [Chloebia gouldiae]